MDKYYSMFETLDGLNLYKLMGNTVIDAELWAYSAGIALLETAIDEHIRETNFTTAQTWGFTRCGYLPWVPNSATLSQKRQMLIARNSIRPDDFTAQGMTKCLAVFGIVASVQCQPGSTTAVIQVQSSPSGVDAAKICAIAEVHLSSHLDFQVG